MASVAVVSPMVAFADDEVGDLSMPTEDEQKAQEVSSMPCFKWHQEMKSKSSSPEFSTLASTLELFISFELVMAVAV